MKPNPASHKYVGQVASDYDTLRAQKPVNIEDDKIIAAFLDQCPPGSTVADVPCGTARAADAVLSRGFSYIGVDASADMIAVAKSKVGENIHARFLQADARATQIADHMVDYVLCIKLIKWLPEDQMILDTLIEFRRICRKQVLVNVKHPPRDKNLSQPPKVRTKPGPESRNIDPEEFERLCGEAGWSIVRTVDNPASRGKVRFYVLG